MKCIRCGKEMRNTVGGNYHCDNCGFGINDLVYRGGFASPSYTSSPFVIPNDDKDATIGSSSITISDYNPTAQYGWICPKCGAVLSPITISCPFCAPKNNQVTATSSGISNTVTERQNNE